LSGYLPLNKKLMVDATKRIRLEGTARTGGDDPRKRRVMADTYGTWAVMRVAQAEGDYGGGVGCVVETCWGSLVMNVLEMSLAGEKHERGD
jgi:hypothetical protein